MLTKQRTRSGVRAQARRLAQIDHLHESSERFFGGGVGGTLLRGEYHTDKVHAWFQDRHRVTGHKLVDDDGFCRIEDHEWKVPYGVRYALSCPLVHAQIATRYPWYVTWISPKTGARLKKRFSSLPHAVTFITTRAQYVDSEASIISRIGYDIPPALRGKLPHRKLGSWCPCCLTARKFYAVVPEQTFFAMKKVWSNEKQRYVPTERKLRVLRCKVCGITNRDAKFRRSNQPWEKRRFKRGVTRARKRK